jgi:hypothetical protein
LLKTYELELNKILKENNTTLVELRHLAGVKSENKSFVIHYEQREIASTTSPPKGIPSEKDSSPVKAAAPLL